MFYALTGVAQLAEHHPTNWKVTGSILHKDTCLRYRFCLSQGRYKRQPIDAYLSHWCFSLSLPPSLPLSLKINKWKIFKNCFRLSKYIHISTLGESKKKKYYNLSDLVEELEDKSWGSFPEVKQKEELKNFFKRGTK